MSAKGILGVEDKGKSSDAILYIKYNNKTQKTKKISSLTPEWKEIFKFPVNFKDRSVNQDLIIFIDNYFFFEAITLFVLRAQRLEFCGRYLFRRL